MKATLDNGIVVHYIEGKDTRTGHRVTSCSGMIKRIYFHLGLPETGPEAVRKLRAAVEDLVSYSR